MPQCLKVRFHGTYSFNNTWKEQANNPKFESDQYQYIKETHYDKQLALLKDAGIDLTNRSPAVLDLVWSTSVQFGPRTTLIRCVLSENGYSPSMDDKQIINLVQDYKIQNNERLFRSSSSEVREGTLKRAKAEKQSLFDLLDKETYQISDEVSNRSDSNQVIKLLSALFDSIKQSDQA